ncbi:hypothetical protein GCM10010129_23690 [Streptomyces fumigatiscleroticus]|nr:hypothetical protein GCM10010129_23690 [Streptomyces fumigatiscleroticus]
MLPSSPVTCTDARVPAVTVTSTGRVKEAFPVPSAGVTVITGSSAAARAMAVAAEDSEASAEPVQPVRAAADSPPRAVRTPRRDHLARCCSDRFDMCASPTAGLPEMSVFAPAWCVMEMGRTCESLLRRLRFR